MTGTLAARRPSDTASMEIAPGIHNVITERAPAVGVTNTFLVVGSEGRVSASGERFTCLDRS